MQGYTLWKWQQKNCKWWPLKDRLTLYKKIKQFENGWKEVKTQPAEQLKLWS